MTQASEIKLNEGLLGAAFSSALIDAGIDLAQLAKELKELEAAKHIINAVMSLTKATVSFVMAGKMTKGADQGAIMRLQTINQGLNSAADGLGSVGNAAVDFQAAGKEFMKGITEMYKQSLDKASGQTEKEIGKQEEIVNSLMQALQKLSQWLESQKMSTR